MHVLYNFSHYKNRLYPKEWFEEGGVFQRNEQSMVCKWKVNSCFYYWTCILCYNYLSMLDTMNSHNYDHLYPSLLNYAAQQLIYWHNSNLMVYGIIVTWWFYIYSSAAWREVIVTVLLDAWVLLCTLCANTKVFSVGLTFVVWRNMFLKWLGIIKQYFVSSNSIDIVHQVTLITTAISATLVSGIDWHSFCTVVFAFGPTMANMHPLCTMSCRVCSGCCFYMTLTCQQCPGWELCYNYLYS